MVYRVPFDKQISQSLKEDHYGFCFESRIWRPIGIVESYAVKAFSYYGYHSRSNINCWCMLRCSIQIGWCYCLFINSTHPGRAFSDWLVTNLYLSIDRDAIESMRRDLYHARLIDFDDSELCIVFGVLLSTNYCMLAKVCLSWNGDSALVERFRNGMKKAVSQAVYVSPESILVTIYKVKLFDSSKIKLAYWKHYILSTLIALL